MRILLVLGFVTFGGGVVWAHNGHKDPHCDGAAIVHLFSWLWNDIRNECDFLAAHNFCGVQISPPHEHAIIVENNNRPWWERYQPVSYKLTTRSGSEQELRDMIGYCNGLGIRIYADVVINHMSGPVSGIGTAGSSFDGFAPDYPGVPFGPWDFNCCQSNCGDCTGAGGNGRQCCYSSNCGVENYGDANQVRNCKLVGLNDLALGKDYVSGEVINALNELTTIGISGYRVDACKHMWPGDMQIIFDSLNGDPFIYQEVIDHGGEAIGANEYTGLGRVTDFEYGAQVSEKFRNGIIDHLLTLESYDNVLWGPDSVVFIDNHDNQRGHGGSGSVLTYKEPREYKMATAFMLAYNLGFPRVMSSYSFTDGEQGPPSDGNFNVLSPNPTNNVCQNGWVCEHRWRQVYQMVEFRDRCSGASMTNQWSGSNQLAFARDGCGFIVISPTSDLNIYLQTSLPAGTYCDVISGTMSGNSCSGKSVTVSIDGWGSFLISNSEEDGVMAIHTGSRT